MNQPEISVEPMVQRLLERLLAPFRDARPRDSLLYSTNHLWFGDFGLDDDCRIGIDDMLRLILSHLHEIIFPVKGHKVPRGSPLAWLCQPTGMVALPAPFPMTVNEINTTVRESPNLALADPYGEGWLANIHLDHRATDLPLLSCSAADAHWKESVTAIDATLHRTLSERSDKSVGETLPDGGRFITSISQLLSPEDYVNLLQDVLRVAG